MAASEASHDTPTRATTFGTPTLMSPPTIVGNSGKNGYELPTPGVYGPSYQPVAMSWNHCPSRRMNRPKRRSVGWAGSRRATPATMRATTHGSTTVRNGTCSWSQAPRRCPAVVAVSCGVEMFELGRHPHGKPRSDRDGARRVPPDGGRGGLALVVPLDRAGCCSSCWPTACRRVDGSSTSVPARARPAPGWPSTARSVAADFEPLALGLHRELPPIRRRRRLRRPPAPVRRRVVRRRAVRHRALPPFDRVAGDGRRRDGPGAAARRRRVPVGAGRAPTPAGARPRHPHRPAVLASRPRRAARRRTGSRSSARRAPTRSSCRRPPLKIGRRAWRDVERPRPQRARPRRRAPGRRRRRAASPHAGQPPVRAVRRRRRPPADDRAVFERASSGVDGHGPSVTVDRRARDVIRPGAARATPRVPEEPGQPLLQQLALAYARPSRS